MISTPTTSFADQLHAFARDLTASAESCRAFLHQVDTFLAAAFHPTMPVAPLLEARSQAVDEIMLVQWTAHLAHFDAGVLLAVGGYGREELYPYSDIDLLIIADGPPSADWCQGVSDMITRLWDIGLSVGHSVRTLEDCKTMAASDLTVVTNMIEARHLAGRTTLSEALGNVISTDKMWSSAAFFTAKIEEQKARHKKFANTEYNLEPNIKSSPGGLRDIQTIGWIARRHYGVPLAHLTGKDFLTDAEHQMLSEGKNFIGQVRFALHTLTGREEDRLLFDHQRKLAYQWGLVDGDKLAVEQFMQVYYRWAQAMNNLNKLLIQIFDRNILRSHDPVFVEPIDDDFEIRNGLIAARHDRVFIENPSNILRLFLLVANDENLATRDINIDTLRWLRGSVDLIDDAFRDNPTNRILFIAILRAPHGMTKQLRRMARHGILGRYLPEFGRIIGQMQFDLFHAYTVDAHTLEVVANTRRFYKGDYTDKFPVSTRIAQRLRRPELLFIAALYHDIGKGRGGDHSELGAVDAEHFCQRHGLDARDTELVAWLVKNHLFMSSYSQRKDISDPEEIQRFAEHVATEERLDYLYTLTVADINGTNPDLWNAWRSSLLRQLYTEARRALRRGLHNPLGRAEVIAATRRATVELLEYRGFLEEDLEALWEARGDDYFLRERPEDIAWHTEAIADHSDPQKPLVLVRHASESPVANATQIFVHAPQAPELFARVCAELELLQLSINDARIYSGTDGATLDTFFVLNSDGTPLANDDETLMTIEQALQNALLSGRERPISKRRSRQLKSFMMPTETQISQDSHKGWTVVEIATPDRPGLLARIGQLFVDLNISLQAAKIQTLGERVEDVFFITDMNGDAITDPQRVALIKERISETLDSDIKASA